MQAYFSFATMRIEFGLENGDCFDLIFPRTSLMLKGMQISRSSVLWCAVFSILMSPSYVRAEGDVADLPPPPENSFDVSATEDDAALSSGAELPPPPDVLAPESSLSAGTEEAPPFPEEEVPPLPEEAPAATMDFESEPLPEMAPPMEATPPTRFSSKTELMDLGLKERIREKELVLWLYAGASYGSASAKGVTTTSTTGTPGGMGYNAGIGWMLAGNLQMALDVTGTPRTISSTVDSAMIGMGPRLGFLSVMALIGGQSGESSNGSGKTSVFAYGAKGGLDIILGHSKNSRVSYGISPEVYYITPQASVGGYNQLGATVSFRIYGYEYAF